MSTQTARVSTHRWLIIIVVFGCRPAIGHGGRVDVSAIRDATGNAVQADRFASNRSYSYYLRGALSGYQGRREESILHLKQAILFDPGSPELRIDLAEQYLQAGQTEQASAELRQSVVLAPGYSRGWIELALLLRSQGHTEEALRHLDKAMVLDPLEPSSYFAQIEILLESGSETEAVEVAKDFHKVWPLSGEAELHLGVWFLGQRRYDKAVEHLSAAQIHSLGDKNILESFARACLAARQFPEAEEALRMLLAREPNSLFALISLGALETWKGNDSAATPIVEAAAAALEDGASLRMPRESLEVGLMDGLERFLSSYLSKKWSRDVALLRAALLEAARRWEDAANAYAVLLSEPGYQLFAMIRRGACLSLALHHEEAIPLLLDALKVDPQSLEATDQLSLAYERAGLRDAAIKLLESATTDNARESGALIFALAELLHEEGRSEQAVALLEALAAARPGDQGLALARAALLATMGRQREALPLVEALLVNDPDNSAALNFVAFMSAEESTDLDRAEAMVRHALRLSPGNPCYLDTLGWIHLKKGAVGLATAELERATTLSPDDPEILAHLGEAYQAAGRRQDAQEAFAAALNSLSRWPNPALRRAIAGKLSTSK